MTPVGCVLVHGYLGGPADLDPLARALAAELGPDGVVRVALPGHERAAPPFAGEAFVAEVVRAAEAQVALGRRPVLVGHSTGGSLALAASGALAAAPALVVLAGTPPRIDAGYAARWSRHAGAGGPDLDDVAALAALVNGLARGRTRGGFPVLIVQGVEDALVPVGEAVRWRGRADAVRVVRVPGGHDLFHGPGAAIAADVVVRAVRDAGRAPPDGEVASWGRRVPELSGALARWPPSIVHLREGPAGRALEGRAPDLGEVVATEPTILNVAVTTRCNLACAACARTLGRIAPRDMPLERLERVLEAVPHAARVVLVGLGEPLLHPRVADLVRRAAGEGRRVSVVTNGTRLDRATSAALLDAGLAALTVSVDAASPAAVARVRSGSDLDPILANLRGFLDERARRGLAGRVGVSAFTAVAADTAGELAAVAGALAPLGLDAVMATDLNFPENAPRSLHRAMTPEQEADLDVALRASLARGLPVLSVHALEELEVPARFRELLLLRGADLAARAARHLHCRSPWQTVPVDPDGEVTVCDCQPDARLGNLLEEPLSAVWNGEAARAFRRRMASDAPPAPCLACPRF